MKFNQLYLTQKLNKIDYFVLSYSAGDLLPISLYQELHILLLFAKLVTSNTEIEWQNILMLTNMGLSRVQTTRNVELTSTRFKKSVSAPLATQSQMSTEIAKLNQAQVK